MSKVEIIAEIAQAHDGSLGIAHSYINALAEAGVDTVKFQMHIASAESSLHEQFRVNFSFEDATRYDYWQRMEFKPEQWIELKKHCVEKGVNFLCSPFSIAACMQLNNMGETRIKIASGEINNQLMHDFVATFATEVLISSGMSSLKELKRVENFYAEKNIKTAIFQCTTSYPTPAEKIGLNVINEMLKTFNCSVGLSDHSGEIYPSIAAVALGATKLEFHAVWDKNMFGPDAMSSLNIAQITELVKAVRFLETANNNPVNKHNAEEFGVLKSMFGKSLAVNKDLPIGHVITVTDLETKKPAGFGILPAEYQNYIGKKLNRALTNNEFLNEKDFI